VVVVDVGESDMVAMRAHEPRACRGGRLSFREQCRVSHSSGMCVERCVKDWVDEPVSLACAVDSCAGLRGALFPGMWGK
jgi:hypothetical protein